MKLSNILRANSSFVKKLGSNLQEGEYVKAQIVKRKTGNTFLVNIKGNLMELNFDKNLDIDKTILLKYIGKYNNRFLFETVNKNDLNYDLAKYILKSPYDANLLSIVKEFLPKNYTNKIITKEQVKALLKYLMNKIEGKNKELSKQLGVLLDNLNNLEYQMDNITYFHSLYIYENDLYDFSFFTNRKGQQLIQIKVDDINITFFISRDFFRIIISTENDSLFIKLKENEKALFDKLSKYSKVSVFVEKVKHSYNIINSFFSEQERWA